MNHTQEPWVVTGRVESGMLKGDILIEDPHGECIAHVYEGGVSDEGDARRIVACVNACEGIDDELLEILQDNDKTLKGLITNLEAQRDELLKLAEIGADRLRREFLTLAERYAGTSWEKDPAYIAAKKAADDAKLTIAIANGHCGKINDGNACTMPAGSTCPDCGPSCHSVPEGE